MEKNVDIVKETEFIEPTFEIKESFFEENLKIQIAQLVQMVKRNKKLLLENNKILVDINNKLKK